MHPLPLQRPAIVPSYNLSMKGMNRFDQLQSTHCIARLERRMPMSLFTFCLDASIQNSYVLSAAISEHNDTLMSYIEIMWHIAVGMESVYVVHIQLRATLQIVINKSSSFFAIEGTTIEVTASVNIANQGAYILLDINNKARVRFYLCRNLSLPGLRLWTRLACTKCKLVFHVNCHALYHSASLLQYENPALHEEVLEALCNQRGQCHLAKISIVKLRWFPRCLKSLSPRCDADVCNSRHL